MAKPPDFHHRLVIDRKLGSLHLAVDLALWAPWTLLFGPSGSGKSSVLRAACGLLGQEGIRFSRQHSEALETPLIDAERSVPSHLLGLAYAPQTGALFPHLDVEQNIAFALSVRGVDETQLDALLEMFEIKPLRARLPASLSGGERQRVNLARAFAVPGAKLLLLDEPFSGMGRALRDRLLRRMRDWAQQRETPVLSVSHDVDEALLLDAEVVVLEEGRIVRQGPASTALTAERANLLNLLQR